MDDDMEHDVRDSSCTEGSIDTNTGRNLYLDDDASSDGELVIKQNVGSPRRAHPVRARITSETVEGQPGSQVKYGQHGDERVYRILQKYEI